MGHIPGLPYEIKKYIYAFHIPLFFFISGYLFNFNKYKNFRYINFIKYKAKKYIIPYFTMGIICLVAFGLVLPLFTSGIDNNYIINSIHFILGLLYSRGGPGYMAWSSPLWFLTALFMTEIIFFTVLRLNPKFPIIVFSIVAAFGYMYSITIGIPLPWNIDVAMVASLFMYLGFLTRKFNLINRINLFLFILLLLLFIASVTFNSKIDMNSRNYGNILLTIISGTVGTVLCIRSARLLKLDSVLNFYGKNTLFIMGYTYTVLNITLIIEAYYVELKNVLISFCFQVLILTMLIWIKNHLEFCYFNIGRG